MKINKKSVSLSLTIFLVSILDLNALSIKESVSKSIEYHPLVKASTNQVLINSEKIKQAKSGYYPKFDVKIRYGNEDSKTKNRNTFDRSEKDYNGGYNIEAVVNQNIFNGFYDESNILKNKAIYKASRYTKKDNIEKLSLNVINTYLEIVRLRNIINFEELNIKKYQEYFLLAEKKSESTGEKSEVLTVSSRLQRAKNEYIKKQWELSKENERFIQLTGVNPTKNMNVELPYIMQNISLSDLQTIMKTKNNKFNEYSFKIKEKKANERIEKSVYYPKVNLELKKYKDIDIESYGNEIDQSSLMIDVRYNIFNGFNDKATMAKAIIERKKLRNEYDKINIEEIEKITTQYELYLSLEERIKVLSKSVNIHKKLRELYISEFKLGKKTIINLVDSQQDLKNANISYINASFGIIKSAYSILYRAGILQDTLNNNVKLVNNSSIN